MGSLLGWGRRRRALEVRGYAEFAAASCEALQSPAELTESTVPTVPTAPAAAAAPAPVPVPA